MSMEGLCTFLEGVAIAFPEGDTGHNTTVHSSCIVCMHVCAEYTHVHGRIVYLSGGSGDCLPRGGHGIPQHSGESVWKQHVVVYTSLQVVKQGTVVYEVPTVRLRGGEGGGKGEEREKESERERKREREREREEKGEGEY